MIIGTSYFVSRRAATRYYKATDGIYATYVVEHKLASGEIHIGKPELTILGDKLILLNEGTRYGVESA